MWLILSVKQEGFVNREQWTTELDKSLPFETKEEALEFVKGLIAQDQEAKVIPIFTGARVVELCEQGRFALRKYGHVRVTNEGYSIRVPQNEVAKARETFPRSMYGFSVSLMDRNGNRIPWTAPVTAPSPVPSWAQKKN